MSMLEGFYSEVAVSNAYDKTNDMFKVSSMQKKFRDSFNGASLDTTKWDTTTLNGGALTFGGGVATMTLPVTANAEVSITSKELFTVPFRSLVGLRLPARQAGQSLVIELVSVDANGNIDNQFGCGWRIDGTGTGSQAIYDTWTGGNPKLSSALTTIVDIGSTFNMLELELFADECWFHSRTLDSTGGRANSYVRHQQIPEPNRLYKLRVRFANGASNVATANLTSQFQFALVNDYAELTAEITAGRGNNVAGSGIYATVGGSVSVSSGNITINGVSNIPYTDSTTNLAANAIFTGTSRDCGSTSSLLTNKVRVLVNHLAGLGHGHLVLEQSTDGTTWRETNRVPIPSDTNFRCFDFPVILRYSRVRFLNGTIAQTAFMLASALIRVDGSVDYAKNIHFTDSITNLAASATFTGVTLFLGHNHSFDRFHANSFSDQVGTLIIEESRDGVTFRQVGSVATVANTLASLEVGVIMPYVRVKYINGAIAQTTFELCSLLSCDR